MAWMLPAAMIAGNVISGSMGADAASSAANTQAQSADKASANTMAMFNTQQQNLQPWMLSGQLGNQALMQFMGLAPAGGVGNNMAQRPTDAPGTNYASNYAGPYPDWYGPTPYGQWGAGPGGGQPSFDSDTGRVDFGQTPGHVWQPSSGPVNGGAGMDMNAPGVAQFDPSKFAMDPSYQWQQQQGQSAIMNNMSASGGTYSGNTLKALENYSQGLASTGYQQALNNYQNWQNTIFSRLSNISGTGANAAGNIAGLGMNAAGAVSNNMIGAGNAMAAGQVGAANNLAGGINSGINNYMMYRAMQPGGGGVPGVGGGSTSDINPYMVGGDYGY